MDRERALKQTPFTKNEKVKEGEAQTFLMTNMFSSISTQTLKITNPLPYISNQMPKIPNIRKKKSQMTKKKKRAEKRGKEISNGGICPSPQNKFIFLYFFQKYTEYLH